MRPIKFRAWNPEKTKIVEYIQYMNQEGKPNFNWMYHDYDAPEGLWVFTPTYAFHEIQQFTGLYDKNGKEIYEGDIVDYIEEYMQEGLIKRSIGTVDFSEGSFKIDSRGTLEDWNPVKVIGNIYENPELLT